MASCLRDTTLVTAHALGCERGERLLFEQISFTVERGDALQIEGPNGSGKTTLLRALAGLFPDHEGNIGWAPGTACLFIGHKPGVRATLTVAENLRWLVELGEIDCDDAALLRALGATGLAGNEDTLAGELSAGQVRRIGLARLYLPTPDVWLLDEPLAAIDRSGIERIGRRVDEHIGAGGAVVFTTHQPLPLAASARRVSL